MQGSHQQKECAAKANLFKLHHSFLLGKQQDIGDLGNTEGRLISHLDTGCLDILNW